MDKMNIPKIFIYLYVYLLGGHDNYLLSLREFRMPSFSQFCMLLGELMGIFTQEAKAESKKGSHSPVLKVLPYYKMYLALRDT